MDDITLCSDKLWLTDYIDDYIYNNNNIDRMHYIIRTKTILTYIDIIIDNILSTEYKVDIISDVDNVVSKDIITISTILGMVSSYGAVNYNGSIVQLLQKNGYKSHEKLIQQLILYLMEYLPQQDWQPIKMVSNDLDIALAIVTDAIRLDAFDINRYKKYYENKYFGCHSAQVDLSDRSRLCRGWQKTILVNKVLKYNNNMATYMGQLLVAPLHLKILAYVYDELADAEIYEPLESPMF